MRDPEEGLLMSPPMSAGSYTYQGLSPQRAVALADLMHDDWRRSAARDSYAGQPRAITTRLAADLDSLLLARRDDLEGRRPWMAEHYVRLAELPEVDPLDQLVWLDRHLQWLYATDAAGYDPDADPSEGKAWDRAQNRQYEQIRAFVREHREQLKGRGRLAESWLEDVFLADADRPDTARSTSQPAIGDNPPAELHDLGERSRAGRTGREDGVTSITPDFDDFGFESP